MLRLILPEDSLHRRVRCISNDHAGSRKISCRHRPHLGIHADGHAQASVSEHGIGDHHCPRPPGAQTGPDGAMALLLGYCHGLSRWNSILRVTRATLGSPGLRAGKSPALLVFRGLAWSGAVAGEEAGHEERGQERGQGEVGPVRGKAAIVSVAAARACGKLTRSGRMPAASTARPTIRPMAW
jgi:hypothetical protein